MKAMKKLALFTALVMLISIVPAGTIAFGGVVATGGHLITFTGGGFSARVTPGGVAVHHNTRVANNTVIEFTAPGFTGATTWFFNGQPFTSTTNTITRIINVGTSVGLQVHGGGPGHGGSGGVWFSHNWNDNQTVGINQSGSLSTQVTVSQVGINSGFTHLHWEWRRDGYNWNYGWNYGTGNWAGRTGSLSRQELQNTNWVRNITLNLPSGLTHAQRGGNWRLHVWLRNQGANLHSDISPTRHVTISGTYTGGFWSGGVWHPSGSGFGGGALGGTTVIGGRRTTAGQVTPPTTANIPGPQDAPPAGAQGPAANLPVFTGPHPTLATPGVPAMRLSIGLTTFTHWGIQQTLEASPFIDDDDRTMVPLRVIAEALDAEVRWSGSTRTVFITRGGVELRLPIGEPLPGGMGTPVIVNDRTFVPLRYVSEVLGARVRWDGATRSVYLYRDVAGL